MPYLKGDAYYLFMTSCFWIAAVFLAFNGLQIIPWLSAVAGTVFGLLWARGKSQKQGLGLTSISAVSLVLLTGGWLSH